jgi:hypothetical protein
MDKWRIYVREALTQLGFAKQCFAEFETAHDAGDIPRIFFNLHHFIVHVANVDKLLDQNLDLIAQICSPAESI